MSNSSLVNYTKISPNSTNPRRNTIKKITIHHMAGNLSVEACGNMFANPARQASSHYGIGTDGRVGLYVDEANRAWTSGNGDNDHQAITIEVANDEIGGNWHVSDKALAKLIDLCVDICQRNGIEKLNYTGDKTGNLTMHKWFQATACPGPYLGSKFPYIAEQVNKRLKADDKPEVDSNDDLVVGDEVRLVSGAKYTTGQSVPNWVIQSQLYVRGLQGNNIIVSTLKAGAITGVVERKYVVKNGQTVATPPVTPAAPVAPETPETPATQTPSVAFKVGDEVKLVAGAKYTSGKSIPSWVMKSKLYVREIQANGNIVVSILKSGAITGVVSSKYLEAYNKPAKFAPYKVQVTADALNIREGAGTNYKIKGCIKDKGIYTIIEENNGWGRLKSKVGWISLAYTKKV